MSFLSALKGFGGWVAKEWTKVFNAAPTIEAVADTVFKYVVPALQIILAAVAPEDAAIVAPIITEVQKDVSVVSGLIFDFGANPTAASMVAAIETDLTDLLTAGHIKDTALTAKLQLVINTVGSLATALKA
jgi:hypothetical protein